MKSPAPSPDRAFRAFADPVRLRILHLLADGETCVGDLVAVLDLPQPTVSRHLRTLREAGLVQVRRDGRWAHYSLTAEPSPLERRLLACVRGCLGEFPELAADRERARALRRTGCCPPRPRTPRAPRTTPCDALAR